MEEKASFPEATDRRKARYQKGFRYGPTSSVTFETEYIWERGSPCDVHVNDEQPKSQRTALSKLIKERGQQNDQNKNTQRSSLRVLQTTTD